MKRRPHCGFTLIEMIVAMVLMAIMAAQFAPVLSSSLQAYDETLENVIVLDKLRYATERLGREIRMVQYANSEPNSGESYVAGINACGDSAATNNRFCITAMNATGITFRSNRGDGTYHMVTIGVTGTSPNQSVTLAYSDVAANAAQALTDQVNSLALSYFQSDGTTTATLAGNTDCANTGTCPAYVEITLTLRHNNNNYVQTTRIGLRTTPS